MKFVQLHSRGGNYLVVAANIAYLKGDWTNRDADIAAALAAHGRAGVPLYLYYAPGAETPVILPQLLSESTVLETIAAPSSEQGE